MDVKEDVDLGSILDDLTCEVWDQQVQALQAEKGPDVRIPPPPELILTLDTSLQSKQSMVSADSFKKVARKLIDNALKFTTSDKDGYVEISLAPHRSEDTKNSTGSGDGINYLRLSVEDTGSGMTNEFVSDQLFTPFAKADKFKAGCGLSMALCSSYVRQMGGSMQVSSDKGRGTTVIVLIPVQTLPERLQNEGSTSNSPLELVYFYRFKGAGLQRLAESISSQLATYGNLYTTTRVEEADYILLPEEVCYEGKDVGELDSLLEQAKEGVKIAVLQAHKDAKIEMKARKIGSPPPLYVTRKPFGPRSFERLIVMANKGAEVLNKGGSKRLSALSDDALLKDHADQPDVGSLSISPNQAQQQRKQPAHHSTDLVFSFDAADEILRATPPAVRVLTPILDTPPPPTFSALCVEDNALNMRILTRVLSQCKIPYSCAVDGEEAVKSFEEKQHNLVLLDINMPKKDGYEACRAMRSIEKGRKSHIVAITALSDDFSKRKGLQECGMDEWLTKPLDIMKFKAKVKAIHEKFKESLQM
jgi:CheY-like chemotaxis protein